MNFDDLKPQKRWVCYRSAEDKAPLNARTGRAAKSTEPATWATYDEAMGRASATDLLASASCSLGKTAWSVLTSTTV